jgi:hypothetical protein
MYEEFGVPKVVIRIRKSKKNRQRNGQKDKQPSKKHILLYKDRFAKLHLRHHGTTNYNNKKQ